MEDGGGGLLSLLPIAIIFVLLYVLSKIRTRGKRLRKKEEEETEARRLNVVLDSIFKNKTKS